jgi:hypothetical protein
MLAIEAASVVDGDVVGNNLILTKHDGSQINAGNVRGPQGPQGPTGQDLPLLAAVPVLDVGVINQIRAGRQLTAQDFTNIGLSAPIGLWNLSDLVDASGNGRNLVNKGAVPFDIGINGVAATAAKFSGAATQVLYIADTGVADPFRIKTGSWGCWVRTAKRTGSQYCLAKASGPAGQYAYFISLSGPSAQTQVSGDGSATGSITGTSDIADDRWHFIVVTYDGGIVRLYVDCNLEGIMAYAGAIFSSSGPLNIGGYGGDAGNNVQAASSVFGRVDEAFVTGDVLTDDQIRNLYCAKIPHTLGVVPNRVTLNVHRRRKGATPTSPDFGTAPQRMYTFSAGSLADTGTQNVALVNNGGAPAIGGADGTPGNAFLFTGGQFLNATDAGLPAALNPRSYGCWFKSVGPTPGSNQTIMCWGTYTANEARLLMTNGGLLQSNSGGDGMGDRDVADGLWHFAVVTEENAPFDGVKRKLYLDGRVVASSLVLNSITLAGATMFRIGLNGGSSGSLFSGAVDSAFVCDFVLPLETIVKLYAKGAQDLGVSPKNVGDHVERMDANNVYAIFDSIESQNTVDLAVPA